MTSKTVVRGPLLSSVVMVGLATAATGLLAVIGFQALPESVVPSTFGGPQHETRNVDVSESPTSVLSTRKPSATPSVAPSSTSSGSSYRYPVRTSTAGPATTTPPRTTATTTSPKATTKPKPTASPTASKSPSPSPSPTCNHPKGKCNKSVQSYDGKSYSGYSTSDAPTYSGTKANGKSHGHGKAKKKK